MFVLFSSLSHVLIIFFQHLSLSMGRKDFSAGRSANGLLMAFQKVVLGFELGYMESCSRQDFKKRNGK